MRRISGFRQQGIVAGFTETGSSGEVLDFNAARNAPVKNPAANLSSITFHSDFNQLELAMPEQIKTINHPLVAGRSIQGGTARLPLNIAGNIGVTNHILVNHNLGYVPMYMVALGNYLVPHGHIIQVVSNGITRNVCPYADTSVIGLRDVGLTTNANLPAITKQYRILVFKKTVGDPTKPLMAFDGTVLSLARNKIRTDRFYVRRVLPSESPYDLNRGPTIDITGGRTRSVTGGNVISDAGYSGSFSGPAFIAIGVP